MKKNGINSFVVALVIYIPILLLFYQFQKELAVDKEETKREPVSFTVLTKEEVERLSKGAIYPSAPKPPTSAKKAGKPASKETLSKDTKEITVSDLNDAFDIFQPAQPSKQTDINSSEVAPNDELVSLYGAMILELSKDEIEYLKSNLDNIGVITQRYLRYPNLAGELGMFGETILHFTLYPNGDISKIDLYKSSGYSLLDDNAINTVEIAYKDYPHPSEPTRIRLRVIYRLY